MITWYLLNSWKLLFDEGNFSGVVNELFFAGWQDSPLSTRFSPNLPLRRVFHTEGEGGGGGGG